MLKSKNLILTALFTALIAVGAFVKIPIPPVPVTLQFLFVNLACLVLSRKNAFISVLIYIIIGLMGIPVFTQGGGLGYVINPTFGYLIGFLASTLVGGFLLSKLKQNLINYIVVSIVNLIVVYIIGAGYYYLISVLYLGNVIEILPFLISYVFIFIPGDLLCAVLSSYLGLRVKKYL